MRYLVTGRTGSGKSTFLSELRQLEQTWKYQFSFIECSLSAFTKTFEEGDRIVILDTPYLLCLRRTDTGFSEKSAATEDMFLTYVTQLPYSTIINNDKDVDALKVLTKKFSKKAL